MGFWAGAQREAGDRRRQHVAGRDDAPAGTLELYETAEAVPGLLPRTRVRRAFAQLLVPAAVGVLWYHAHVHSDARGSLRGTWREGTAVVTGNPYAAPQPRATWAPFDDPDAGPDDESPQAVADLSAPDDARH